MKNMGHFVMPSLHATSMGFFSLNLTSGFILWFMWNSYLSILISIFLMIFLYYHWWSMVGRERSAGEHSCLVEDGLKIGMSLFILSEIFFFFSFFWSFFHNTFSPSLELGGIWPPLFLSTMNPNNIPLVNTIILLSSGVMITWSHSSLLGNQDSKSPLFLTFSLGFYFLFIQGAEYYMSSTTISDSVYGSIFFLSTGFHGLHVFVGTIFLVFMYLRFLEQRFNSWTHISFELSIWYWHFVDVIWLFLFSFIYFWGD